MCTFYSLYIFLLISIAYGKRFFKMTNSKLPGTMNKYVDIPENLILKKLVVFTRVSNTNIKC